jgi:hypothetical protein
MLMLESSKFAFGKFLMLALNNKQLYSGAQESKYTRPGRSAEVKFAEGALTKIQKRKRGSHAFCTATCADYA